jgi:hypothetical protein
MSIAVVLADESFPQSRASHIATATMHMAFPDQFDFSPAASFSF